MPNVVHPRVEITYCNQCKWLLRSAWYAQELLSTFAQEIGEVALIPSSGGVFRISVADHVIWDRTYSGGFPDIKRLKQAVREQLAPFKDLGHLEGD